MFCIFHPLPLSYNIHWIFMCHVHYSFSIDFKKKERKYSEQLYVKKQHFFNARYDKWNHNIWKKPHGSLYVAYIQESPESVNPSISSLPVLFCFFFFWNSSNVKKIYLSINEWPVNFYPNLPWEVDFGTGDALSTKVTTDTIPDLHARGPTILPHNKNAPPGQAPTGPRASVAWSVRSWKSSVHVQTPVSYQLKLKAPRSTAGQRSHSRCRDGFHLPNNWSWVKRVVGTHRADADERIWCAAALWTAAL